MESQSDPKPWYYWQFSKRTTVVALVALGLFLLVFQVNKMLSSSFRIEIFDDDDRLRPRRDAPGLAQAGSDEVVARVGDGVCHRHRRDRHEAVTQ